MRIFMVSSERSTGGAAVAARGRFAGDSVQNAL